MNILKSDLEEYNNILTHVMILTALDFRKSAVWYNHVLKIDVAEIMMELFLFVTARKQQTRSDVCQETVSSEHC